MQFEVLVSIVSEDLEEETIKCLKESGAGGVTTIKGHALGLKEKKIFFGLTLEDNVSIILTILPKKLIMPILKALRKELNLEDDSKEGQSLVFTLPISHLMGINTDEIELFESEVKDFL